MSKYPLPDIRDLVQALARSNVSVDAALLRVLAELANEVSALKQRLDRIESGDEPLS